jgi:S-adenosylmethionine/arginine decarboxylase-like enzyme
MSYGGKTLDVLGFGSHLIIDGFGAEAALLGDETRVEGVTQGFAEVLGEIETGRQLLRHEGGLSMLLLLDEAHLSLHTFAPQRSLSLSVFSRRSLNLESILEKLREGFGAGRLESYMTSRSASYCSGLLDVSALLAGERAYASARLADGLVGLRGVKD